MKVSKEGKIKKDIFVIEKFIEIFCKSNHKDIEKAIFRPKGNYAEYASNPGLKLCSDCNKLLLYAIGKRIICPYDPKPRCKKCLTHCYRDDYGQRIREVMRFSGAYLLKRGRLDLIAKYFF